MLSRRHFLQLAGITVASVSLPQLTSIAAAPAALPTLSLETIYGRAFGTTRVYDAPSIASKIGSRLWANTVTPILDAAGDWYHLPDGYVLRRNMQPMIAPTRPSETTFNPPFWAEVTGALGIVRESCSATAPITRQIGHGGILRVIDWLPGDGLDWYGVADSENGALVGWTQTAVWSPVDEEALSPSLSLAVDTAVQRLTVYDGDHSLLTAPISTDRSLTPGIYPISERSISRRAFAHFGAPWSLRFGADQYLVGVYWHNQFGNPTSGEALQVTPPLARWLYSRAESVIIS